MCSTPEIICCGHAAYDFNFLMQGFPVEDEKYRIETLIETGGGPAANAASLIARWGGRSTFAGLLGGDIYGRLLLQEFDEWGVDRSLAVIEPDAPTPVSAVIVNTETGTRTLLNRRDEGRQPRLTENIRREIEMHKPEVLLFDGHAYDLSIYLSERFPGAVTVMDAGSFRQPTDLLSVKADYLIASRRFAAEAAGIDPADSAESASECLRRLKRRYPGRIAVTLGAGGVVFDEQEEAVRLDAFRVEPVDSTGAGDIFHGAFAYGLTLNLSYRENLRFASAAAALSVTKAGGKPSIPDINEVFKLIGE